MIKIKANRTQKRNALISLICIIAVLATSCLGRTNKAVNITNQEVENVETWGIGIYDFSIQEELKSIRQIVLYGGDTQESEYADKAPDGKEYLIIGLEIIKGEKAASSFNTDNIVVKIKGDTYSRMTNENLLESHNYATLLSGEIENEISGYIGFEIPKGSKLGKIKLSYEDEVLNISKNISVDIEKRENIGNEDILNNQRIMEKSIMTEYTKSEYSIENPYIKLNPYKNAPLTAIVMFETESESEISIRVEGMDEYSHVDNTFKGYKTHHEIPVYGLYAGYDNSIIIEAKNETGEVKTNTINIKTEGLPVNMPEIDIVTVDREKYQSGMNFTYNTENKMIFDINGDIRWYYGLDTSQSYKLLKNGNMLIARGSYHSGDVDFYEINPLGKIYNAYYSPYGVHHDIEETSNNTLLITSSREDNTTVEDFIVEIDRSTGEIVKEIDLKMLFDPEMDSELYSEIEWDWFHNNAISWDSNDDTMILSSRKQSVVSKISGDGKEIKWIMSPNEGWSEEYKEYLLTPIGEGFEWQYSQHAPKILPDLDGNSDTIDVLLFDNGNNRSFDGELLVEDDENYSRLVHYRVNEKEMTIEQIWQYGKERGRELFSEWRSDSSRLENGNVLGIFSLTYPGHYCKFIEVDENKSVVFEAVLSNGDSKGEYQNYRGERRDIYSVSDDEFTMGKVAQDFRPNDLNKVKKKDIIDKQNDIEKDIVDEYNLEKHTIDNPYTVLNPYEVSPLSALIMFESDNKSKVKVKVTGKDEESSIEHEFEEYSKSHKVPIYGLYPNMDNTVVISEIARNGEVVGEKAINIKTEELPNLMYDVDFNSYDEGAMANGLTFMFPSYNILPYVVALDNNGDVRWYCDANIMGSDEITPLKNGRFITNSGKLDYLYYMESLYEIDLLGKIYKEYAVDGKHHDVSELSNGNLLVVADNPSGETVEDYMVELNRETGEIVKTLDLKKILPMNDYIADKTYQKLNFFGDENKSRSDWFHQNALYYDESDNSIVVSGRHQDMVVKIDYETEEVKWILSDPNDDWTPELKDKLLTPTGENFDYQYGQHSVQVLPNGDIFVFDNGTYRTKDGDSVDKIKTEDKYSRGVIYRVNENNMTVEKIWEYGKELGVENYSSYISSVSYLNKNHYLINFGGILKDSEGNYLDSIINAMSADGAKGEAKIVEIKDDKVIGETHLTGEGIVNIYRAKKFDIYNNAVETEFWPTKELGKLTPTKSENVVLKDIKILDLGIEVEPIKNDSLQITVNGKCDIDANGVKYYIGLEGEETYFYPISFKENTFKTSINKSGIISGKYYINIYSIDETGNSIKQPLNRYIEI